jgi:hypothetical protein
MAIINNTDQGYYEGSDLGNYQFTSLVNIIDAFMFSYDGSEKFIDKVNRTEVGFHAQRALQELSFDTLKCVKAQEIEVPPSLQMILPKDYVNYVKISRVDSSGIERVLYPELKTYNPTALQQDADGDYSFTGSDIDTEASTMFNNYSATTIVSDNNQIDYDTDLYDLFLGQRYGLDPGRIQANGNFYIDELNGKINFSSNLAGNTIMLKYISDGLGTEAEMRVHKFAEEAMYKSIFYAVISNKINIPEYVVLRAKKEKRAAVRNAKLRLSNVKLEEISQILRGKSKHIKH